MKLWISLPLILAFSMFVVLGTPYLLDQFILSKFIASESARTLIAVGIWILILTGFFAYKIENGTF